MTERYEETVAGRPSSERKPEPPAKKGFWANPAWTGVAGLASIVVAVSAIYGVVIVARPQGKTISAEITAQIPGTDYATWRANPPPPRRDAPQIPAAAQRHTLDDLLPCGVGYRPVKAWHEIVGSWPSIDVMYTVNANVIDGEVVIDLRSRDKTFSTQRPYAHGYAYVEVFVRCQAPPPGRVGPELAWEKQGRERILGDVILEGGAK